MKVAILAGGFGSRLSEETKYLPKPLVEIGGKPIIWHVMRHYDHYDINEFVIALGYKGECIKQYFVDYTTVGRNLMIDFKTGNIEHTEQTNLDWSVELVDTGADVKTGGRIKRLKPHLGNQTFMLTWCDGVSDVDLDKLLDFHRSHGKLATLTAVHPPARFGHLELNGNQITRFVEKPHASEGWINGAFFVLEPEVFDFIAGDETQFEKEPLEQLAAQGQLMAYQHQSFWQCMDTLRDKELLQNLWDTNNAPWKTWSENT